MTDPTVVHLRELGFTVVARAADSRVDFTIYDISGWEWSEATNEFDTTCWAPDIVKTLDEAEVYLHGEVKWDGCSNWHFDEQDRVMLHGCSKSDIQRFGDVMAACWDMAATMLPGWDGAAPDSSSSRQVDKNPSQRFEAGDALVFNQTTGRVDRG